jgi:hypothetical protein
MSFALGAIMASVRIFGAPLIALSSLIQNVGAAPSGARTAQHPLNPFGRAASTLSLVHDRQGA